MKIDQYETNTVEFKVELSNKKKRNWLKKVCAMANSLQGGILFVGVSDERDVIRVEDLDSTIDMFVREVGNCITPKVEYDIKAEPYNDKTILKIEIVSGNQTPYQLRTDGSSTIYVMQGNTTVPASQSDLIQLALRSSRDSWDNLVYKNDFIPSFSFLNKKYEEINNDILYEKDLRELRLLKNNNVTNAGMLLSDDNKSDNSWISVTVWGGLNKSSDEGINDKEFRGSIISQIDNSYEFIKESITSKMMFNDTNAQREDIWEYDLFAIRESLINAVVHRDYSINNNQQIEVGIYKDRIEFKSTGELMNNHTIDDLINYETIGRRNPVICNVMKDLRYIETRGRGISKILNPKLAWKKEPEFINTRNYFQVTLFSRFYKEDDVGNMMLNENELLIIEYLKTNEFITGKVAEKVLGLGKSSANYYLNSLVDKKLITANNSRPIKYYLIEPF